jgi:hypothetical protein
MKREQKNVTGVDLKNQSSKNQSIISSDDVMA